MKVSHLTKTRLTAVEPIPVTVPDRHCRCCPVSQAPASEFLATGSAGSRSRQPSAGPGRRGTAGYDPAAQPLGSRGPPRRYQRLGGLLFEHVADLVDALATNESTDLRFLGGQQADTLSDQINGFPFPRLLVATGFELD